MINKKKRNYCFFILLSVFVLFSFLAIQISNPEIEVNNNINYNNVIDLKQSGYYLLDEIHIDDDDPDSDYHSWGWRAANDDWCEYNVGEDVYYIRDVVINGGGFIDIRHSTKNFVIENCTVINSVWYGIRLRDVENGKLRKNTFSNNTYDGILVKYMEWFDFPYTYEDSSNNIEIWNNTVSYNSNNGICIEGKDNSLTCDNNNITGNTLIGNTNDGISITYGDINTVINNTCLSNGGSGIYIDDSDGDTINENTCSSNNGYGIRTYDSDGNTINDNDCNYNYHGIYLVRSDDNIINDNNASNNDEVGLYVRSCAGTQSEWSNEISGNTVNNNNIGIHLDASDYTHVGTGNTVSGNTQYGIYLSEASANNKITGNVVSNNGVYDICYIFDCKDNIFLNNGVTAIKLGDSGSGEIPPSGLEYLLSLLFIVFFVAVIGGIAYINRSKKKKLRENGAHISYSTSQPRVTFVRPGLVIQEQDPSHFVYSGDSHGHKNEPITPKEIEPYEFYCAKCEQKSLGYQVFCPTCGERMRQPKLATMHNPDEKVQCVICHAETCSTCGHGITGDDACFEECPYCERSYHKHCWNKTMQAFGKCGFCLETPPPELIPNAFKTQDNSHYLDP